MIHNTPLQAISFSSPPKGWVLKTVFNSSDNTQKTKQLGWGRHPHTCLKNARRSTESSFEMHGSSHNRTKKISRGTNKEHGCPGRKTLEMQEPRALTTTRGQEHRCLGPSKDPAKSWNQLFQDTISSHLNARLWECAWSFILPSFIFNFFEFLALSRSLFKKHIRLNPM